MQTTLRLTPVPRVAWLLVVLALIVSLAVAVLAIGSRPRLPEPFGVARNGSVLTSINGDIARIDPGTGVATVVVGGAEQDLSPSFSRDGSRFVFDRISDVPGRDHLMVAAADGTGVRTLSDPLVGANVGVWSPTGSEMLVLHTSDAGRRVLSVLDTSGTGRLRTLPLGEIEPTGWADWRPIAGSEVIFRGHPQVGSTDVALYAIESDGSGLHPITPAVSDDATYDDPQISPDGSRLTYWNFEPLASGGATDGWTHVLDLGSGVDTQVRFSTGAAEVHARFSPDGTKVLVERQGLVAPYPAQMIIAPVNGGSPAMEIGPSFPFDTPHEFGFSPDGQQVILTTGGNTQFFRVSDGTSVTDLLRISEMPSIQRLAP